MKRTTWFFPDLSALGLHLLAMVLMLCDHLWATVIPGNNWLTWLGRMAFPMFAFLIAEGFHFTRDRKRYRRRMLVFALISEIPFNLMYGASWFYPFQQNVLWTFLFALLCLDALDRLRAKPHWPSLPLCALTVLGYLLLATVTLVDYGGWGVLTVVMFSLFRGRRWYHRLGQFLGLAVINLALMGGQILPVTLLGHAMEFPIQGFSLLALIPIWCYRGRQGPNSKAVQYLRYGFYPAHMLILGLISL